eukprot:TRINITY_DN3299_c1_g2_i1.p1 TRINITY_DN3299_c1_g2~~TRINITY_DN3299_c1_g2_i1.p1  ORF type:complete len:433 (+),score=104.74 TRINITY_DN3299_c1_g2_i1:31-1299(+)
MIAGFFILSNTGDLLISRSYSPIVSKKVSDHFFKIISQAKEDYNELPSVLQTSKYFFVHLKIQNCYYVCICLEEQSPVLLISLMENFADKIADFLDRKDVTSYLIQTHTAKISLMLDDFIVAGVPVIIDSAQMRDIVSLKNPLQILPQLSSQTSNGLPWRDSKLNQGIQKVLLDVIEKVNVICDANGAVTASSISGVVAGKCKLSGMPQLSLRFKNPSILQTLSFHHCVKYRVWETSRLIQFVPPEGRFKLLRYTVAKNNVNPFNIKCSTELTAADRLKVLIKIGPKPDMTNIQDFKLTLTVPQTTNEDRITSLEFSSNRGHCNYSHFEKSIVLDLERLVEPIELEGMISFTPSREQPNPKKLVGLIDRVDGIHPNIQLKFKIPGQSFMQIDKLEINNSIGSGEIEKGKKSATSSGDFCVVL